jgi:GDP/GTP exchange factor required for growth at low temperature
VVELSRLDLHFSAASLFLVSGTWFLEGERESDYLLVGIFLRDLSITAELPTFLDPTRPNCEACVDEKTHELESVMDPKAFKPLPVDVPLTALVNVHKFRMQALVVQRILVFQEMASLNPRAAQAGLFRKCLALRSLSVNTLGDCSRICEP